MTNEYKRERDKERYNCVCVYIYASMCGHWIQFASLRNMYIDEKYFIACGSSEFTATLFHHFPLEYEFLLYFHSESKSNHWVPAWTKVPYFEQIILQIYRIDANVERNSLSFSAIFFFYLIISNCVSLCVSVWVSTERLYLPARSSVNCFFLRIIFLISEVGEHPDYNDILWKKLCDNFSH